MSPAHIELLVAVLVVALLVGGLLELFYLRLKVVSERLGVAENAARQSRERLDRIESAIGCHAFGQSLSGEIAELEREFEGLKRRREDSDREQGRTNHEHAESIRSIRAELRSIGGAR